MCLLFSGTSAKIRSTFLGTPGLIENVYGYNSDGFGFMFPNEGKVETVKGLPKNAGDVRKMFEALPDDDRQLAGHARMRTHGATNLENCHPYEVNGKSWLMHNGILHTGNKADPTKSDTWHFVKDFLATMGDNALHDAGALRMIGEFISNNRFAIMSPDGRLSVVNREQGIEHDGVWYSNTYAWDAGILVPSERKVYQFANYTRSRPLVGRYQKDSASQAYDDYINGTRSDGLTQDAEWEAMWAQEQRQRMEDEGIDDYDELVDMIEQGLYELEPAIITDCLETDTVTTTRYLFDNYNITQNALHKDADNSPDYNAALACWLTEDVDSMENCFAHDLAEALCYSTDVEWRQSRLMAAEPDNVAEEAEYAEAVREVRALHA